MKKGRIIVITGSPGTGKTTAAGIIAKESDLDKSVHMHTDDFYHFLSKGAIPPHLPESDKQNSVVIEAFLEAAKRYVRGGYDVIVDGIIGPWFLEPWLNTALEGYEVHYIVLRATKEETMKRAIGRSRPDKEADAELVETMWAQFHNLGIYEKNVIDTTLLSVRETVDEIKRKTAGKTALLPTGHDNMKKILEHQVPFPVGAESDNFTAALASALVIARGYTEETPYWCTSNRRYCIHCSPCGNHLLERHQESLYHCLLTASTLAFGFDYPWDDTVEPHSLPGFRKGWRWDEDFVHALARFAGFSYLRFDGTCPQEDVLSTMKNALDTGFPTLLRLENERAWILAVGYDTDTVYGLDSRFHALPGNWQSTLRDAIVITGNTAPGMSCKELLERIASALSYEGHTALESVIMDTLDHVTPENAMDTANMMNGINGVPIEARWHAAEGFCGADNLLSHICTDKEVYSRLRDTFYERYIKDGNDETHGIGWKIWGALGVGPETGYDITRQSAALILQKETQETLKRLFAKMFGNDRAVCAEIRACLEKL